MIRSPQRLHFTSERLFAKYLSYNWLETEKLVSHEEQCICLAISGGFNSVRVHNILVRDAVSGQAPPSPVLGNTGVEYAGHGA